VRLPVAGLCNGWGHVAQDHLYPPRFRPERLDES
jgi:hypothetical protein